MFNIKLYQKDWSTKISFLELDKLSSVWASSAEINGWYGSTKISFVLPISNTNFEIWNIIRLQFEKNLLFRWSIIEVKKVYWKRKQTIELKMIWLSWLAWTIQTNAIYTDTASNIMKDLIDNFNIEYGSNILSYDSLTIPDSVWNISLDFSKYTSYLNAMKEVAETSGLFMFIDNLWIIYLKERSNFDTHKLKTWKQINTLSVTEDWTDLVNKLILKYATWTKTYQDAPSQAQYTVREKYIDKSSELSNVATADIYWASYLSQYKDKIKKISIQVNNEYNFFEIKPWDLMTIRNINYDIAELQVVKVRYWLETCDIELEVFYSFAKEIFNN